MTKFAALTLLLATSAAAQTPVTPPGFTLPGGEGCAGAIARYRAVQENDHASGNVAGGVYAQIQREIAAAEKVCAAGDDAKATQLIRASQSRHGYSTGL